MVEDNKNIIPSIPKKDIVQKENVLEGLKAIKPVPESTEIKKVEMEAVAIDGFGNRVFVSEKKAAAFKKKHNL